MQTPECGLLVIHVTRGKLSRHAKGVKDSADNSLVIIHFWGQQEQIRRIRPSGALAADAMNMLADKGDMMPVHALRSGAEKLLAYAKKDEPLQAPELVLAHSIDHMGRDTGLVERWAKLTACLRAYERRDPKGMQWAQTLTPENLERLDADAEELRVLLARKIAVLAVERDGEISFGGSMEGAIYISAVMGIARGSLRFCQHCNRPFTGTGRAQHRKQRCDVCRDEGAAARLGKEAQTHWRRVSGRMQRRFRRSNQAERYRTWREAAWGSLLYAKGIEAWEAEYAAPVRRGRRPQSA